MTVGSWIFAASLIILGGAIYFIVRFFRRGGRIGRPNLNLIRINNLGFAFFWKAIAWIFSFIALILVIGLIRNYQENRRITKSENRKLELAKNETRKLEVISQIPASVFDQSAKKAETAMKQSEKKKTTHAIYKMVDKNCVVRIPINGEDYTIITPNNNGRFLQFSEDGKNWQDLYNPMKPDGTWDPQNKFNHNIADLYLRTKNCENVYAKIYFQ